MKYTYSVSFAIVGRSACHAEQFGNAPAAIAAAQFGYAALQCTLEPERDTLPSFAMIRRADCPRVQAEPRNRAFAVAITKRAR